MTIKEIQSNLDQLKDRHPNLNKKLLFILLSAGGWDDISIKEAIILFKSMEKEFDIPHQDNIPLPELPKLLLDDKNIEEKKLLDEPVLVSENKKVIVKEEVILSDDLPIKITESSSNFWNFADYRDAFHKNEKVEAIDNTKISDKKISKDEIDNIHKRRIHHKKRNEVTSSLIMFLLVIFLMVIYMFFK